MLGGELAPATSGHAQIQRIEAVELGILEIEPAQVGIGPLAIPGIESRAVLVVVGDGDVAAHLAEVLAPEAVERAITEARALAETVLHADLAAIDIVTHDVVDHAGHRVGTVQRRCAIEQYVDPAQVRHRDRVGVVGQHWHKLLICRAGGVDHGATAVDQQQGVAHAQATQVDRGHVATGVVAAVGAEAIAEGHVTHLRDGPEQFVAADHAQCIDLLGLDANNREQQLGIRRALDLGTDHFHRRKRRYLALRGRFRRSLRGYPVRPPAMQSPGARRRHRPPTCPSGTRRPAAEHATRSCSRRPMQWTCRYPRATGSGPGAAPWHPSPGG